MATAPYRHLDEFRQDTRKPKGPSAQSQCSADESKELTPSSPDGNSELGHRISNHQSDGVGKIAIAGGENSSIMSMKSPLWCRRREGDTGWNYHLSHLYTNFSSDRVPSLPSGIPSTLTAFQLPLSVVLDTALRLFPLI